VLSPRHRARNRYAVFLAVAVTAGLAAACAEPQTINGFSDEVVPAAGGPQAGGSAADPAVPVTPEGEVRPSAASPVKDKSKSSDAGKATGSKLPGTSGGSGSTTGNLRSVSGVYWGVVGDLNVAQQRSGETLARHTYGIFSGKVPTDRMVTVRSEAATWQQVTSAAPGSTTYANIARWADTLKARRSPVLVAYHHEPELGGNRRYGNAPEFIAAYRRVVSIFRARGATNVSFVWQMTDWAFRTSSSDPQFAAKWYPGDKYVDVVGADAYNWYTCGHGRGRWMQLEALAGPMVSFAKAHGRKASLPEFGSVQDSRRPAWITEAGRWLKSQDATMVAAFYFHHKPTHAENAECTWPLSSASDFSAVGRLASTATFKP
jgi:hypothetical protein